MRGRTVLLAVGAAFFLGLCMVTAVGAYFLFGTQQGGAENAHRTLPSFERIDFSGVGNLIITQGDEETIQIDAPERTRSRIRIEVRGDTLHISPKGTWFGFFSPIRDVTYHVTVRELTGIDVSGAGDVFAEEIWSEEFEIDSSGASDVNIKSINVERLRVDLSGAGSVEIGGTAGHQAVDISGSGRYKVGDLQSESVSLDLSGAGKATVWVEDDLDVEVSGAGSVDYYGSPQVSQDISGVGHVASLGEHSR